MPEILIVYWLDSNVFCMQICPNFDKYYYRLLVESTAATSIIPRQNVSNFFFLLQLIPLYLHKRNKKDNQRKRNLL